MAKRLSIALFAAFGILLAPPAGAQSTFGSIVGVVRDPTQAAVIGAVVTLRSLDDNNARAVVVGGDGAFEFVNLKPGYFSLTAQAPGFAEFHVSLAQLAAQQTLRLDIDMALKSESLVVEVSGEAVAVNTENATLSDSKGNTDITQLPINSRSVSSSPLAALAVSAP